MAKQPLSFSDFYCVECGHKGIPIVRNIGAQRESGHLKNLFCLNCGKECNHAEIRPGSNYTYEDFKLEFESGRFVDGKRIPIADLISCNNSDCKYNFSGKCWNANKSFNCGHR